MDMCYKLIILLVIVAVVLYCYPMITGWALRAHDPRARGPSGKEGFQVYYPDFMYPSYTYPSYWYPGHAWGKYPPGYYFGRPRYWYGPGRRNWRWRWW